jgi:transcriptional regulator with XRE-family HTH domain
MSTTPTASRLAFSPRALVEARERAGLTRRRLSVAADVAEDQIGAWERGDHGMSLRNAQRLAVALGVLVDDLLDHEVST